MVMTVGGANSMHACTYACMLVCGTNLATYRFSECFDCHASLQHTNKNNNTIHTISSDKEVIVLLVNKNCVVTFL